MRRNFVPGDQARKTGGLAHRVCLFPALRSFGGLWTRPLLNKFLANPAEVIPGTTMRFEGMPDRRERLALIEYLRQSQ